MVEHALVSLSAVVILGIAAQWLGWRVRIPSILLLLVFGIVAGPILGWIHPGELLGSLLYPVVSLAVAVILFEGGLSLSVKEFRAIGGVVAWLVTLGAGITWVIGTLAAHCTRARLAAGDPVGCGAGGHRSHGHWADAAIHSADRPERRHPEMGRDRHRSDRRHARSAGISGHGLLGGRTWNDRGNRRTENHRLRDPGRPAGGIDPGAVPEAGPDSRFPAKSGGRHVRRRRLYRRQPAAVRVGSAGRDDHGICHGQPESRPN